MTNKYAVGIQEWSAVNWKSEWANPIGSRVATQLADLDMSARGKAGEPTPFSSLVSRACQGRDFRDERYASWARTMGFGPYWHRKFWEWAAIMEAAELAGVLLPAKKAVGFGVGQEPIRQC